MVTNRNLFCPVMLILFISLSSGGDDPAQYLESGRILSHKLGRFGVGFQVGPCFINSLVGDEDISDINFGGAGFLDVDYGVKTHLHPYIGFFMQNEGADRFVSVLETQIDSLEDFIKTASYVPSSDTTDLEALKYEKSVREMAISSLVLGMNLIMMSPRDPSSKIRLFGGGGGGGVLKFRSIDNDQGMLKNSQLSFMWDLACGIVYSVSDKLDTFLELRQTYVLKETIVSYSN